MEKIDKRAKQNIMNLFGGEEEFMQLPVLNFPKDRTVLPAGLCFLIETHNPLDNNEIYLEDLTAPIMRGIDSSGRPFFVIRHKTDNKTSCTTFFQTSINCGRAEWRVSEALSSNLDIYIQKFLINNDGNIIDKGYNIIKNFIETSKFDYHRVFETGYVHSQLFEIC